MTPEPTQAEIAARAHEIWVRRGSTPGRALDDWLQAERELKSGAFGAVRAAPAPTPPAASAPPRAPAPTSSFAAPPPRPVAPTAPAAPPKAAAPKDAPRPPAKKSKKRR
jgi:hypothetical protein